MSAVIQARRFEGYQILELTEGPGIGQSARIHMRSAGPGWSLCAQPRSPAKSIETMSYERVYRS